jgi:hypothetical protein
VANIVNRRDLPITSVRQWGTRARPAAAVHWQDGRSAKELARAWINGTGETDLLALLDLAKQTRGFSIRQATAEAQTAFDDWPGGRRNHDLLVDGDARGRPVTVGLEAKADESFGQTLASYARAADRKVERREATNAPQRLAGLLKNIAGTTLAERPELKELRYQLFSGVAGTLAAADANGYAAFVVHEFDTSKTTQKKHEANAAALATFVREIFRVAVPSHDRPWLVGPFHVPAPDWASTPLWIGHLKTKA